MIEQLIGIGMAIITGILVMILHELPKSIIYNHLGEKKYKGIWKVYQYIDPIGLVFCITAYAGFSRPFMYRIKEKRINLILGITGFLSLVTIFIASIVVLRFQYSTKLGEGPVQFESYIGFLNFYFWASSAKISLGMILVNLFPVSTFDLGLIIAGKSPSKYFAIIRSDYFIKMILILSVMLGLISMISNNVIGLLVHVI